MFDFLNSPIYYNKAECRFRNGVTKNSVEFESVWKDIIANRKANGIMLPLQDQTGKHYFFSITDTMEETMKKFEELHLFLLENSSLFENAKTKIAELEEETIFQDSLSSAQIEGSNAKKIEVEKAIKTKKTDNSLSVQMVINNIYAYNYILQNLDKPLSKEFIIKLWNIIIKDATDQIISNYNDYRDDYVYVTNSVEVVYTAPESKYLENLMDDFIRFFNTHEDIPELIKAGIIHFVFETIHPFFDGNGRLGRALTNMYLLQNGIDIIKYSNLTSIILSKKQQYYKKLQESRNDDGDITYFIIFHCELMIELLHNGLELLQKIQFEEKLVKLLSTHHFTPSQTLIIKSVTSSSSGISIQEAARIIEKSSEMARLELNKLVELGILTRSENKKNALFVLKF